MGTWREQLFVVRKKKQKRQGRVPCLSHTGGGYSDEMLYERKMLTKSEAGTCFLFLIVLLSSVRLVTVHCP